MVKWHWLQAFLNPVPLLFLLSLGTKHLCSLTSRLPDSFRLKLLLFEQWQGIHRSGKTFKWQYWLTICFNLWLPWVLSIFLVVAWVLTQAQASATTSHEGKSFLSRTKLQSLLRLLLHWLSIQALKKHDGKNCLWLLKWVTYSSSSRVCLNTELGAMLPMWEALPRH